MGRTPLRKTGLLATLLVAVFIVGGCSEEETTGREISGDFLEGTLSSSDGGPKTTPLTTETPDTTGVTAGASEVQLRLEGDPQTTFSGICTAGSEEYVIRDQVPQRYTFDLNGGDFSCRVQKRDPGDGNLRVVLIAGESTRSVQQTRSRDSVIRLSYAGS